MDGAHNSNAATGSCAPGVGWVAEIEERNVRALARFQAADIVAAQALRATNGSHA